MAPGVAEKIPGLKEIGLQKDFTLEVTSDATAFVG
jgi:hypothetical protein